MTHYLLAGACLGIQPDAGTIWYPSKNQTFTFFDAYGMTSGMNCITYSGSWCES
jgi:hypothetical protein